MNLTHQFWLICCFSGSGVNIQQVFPSDPSYSCPGPSLTWICTYPEEATNVVWSCPGVTHIRGDYPGHVINNSMVNSTAVSYLYVNNSSDKKEKYSCIVLLGDVSEMPKQEEKSTPETASKCPICNIVCSICMHKHAFT